MNVNESKYQVRYPQRSENGGVDAITVSKGKFVKDSLMTLYLTC